jgi:hypothetical protein
MIALLHRGEERIHINMENDAGHLRAAYPMRWKMWRGNSADFATVPTHQSSAEEVVTLARDP